MKTCQSTGYLQQAIRKLLLGVVSAMVVSAPAYAFTPPNNIDACFDCHGSTNDIRPLDSGFRNVSTGAFSGNHRTHISTATTVSNVCVVCHGPAPVALNHRDGKIYLNNGSIKNGSYSKGPFFNQTSVPTPGSCSSVNCHFNTVTPNWGTSPTWSGTKTANDQNINCASCHSASTLASGTHTKHITAGGGTQTACKSCHPDYNALAGTNAFQHATSAARPINVNFSAAPNLGGAYAGGRSATQFLPPGAIAATGSCSALYCHSPGTKSSAYNSPATPPVWGGSIGCTGCHGAQIASFKVITSGSHAGHVMGSGGSSYSQIKCVTCHAATATAGMTISDVSKHVNKSVDVAFANSSSAVNGSYNGSLANPASPSSKAPGTAAGSCQNVYCHSTAQHSDGTALQAADFQTPTWGNAASGQCGTCHALTGSTDHGSFPGYVKAGPAIASGKHTKHLSYTYGLTDNSSNDYRCALCHANDKTAFTTSNPTTGCTTICHNGTTATMHANNKVDVNIANYVGASASYSGTPKPGDGYGSCTFVYCHSDGQATPGYVPTVSWSTAGPLACTACHGSATVNSPAGTALSGKHAAHVNPAVNISLGTGNGFGCVECHQKTVANNTTLNATTGTTFHVDKFVEYTGVRAGGPLRYNSATKQCSNFYCHSNGNQGAIVYTNPAAWNSATTYACNGCHGTSNPATGAPDYANGGSGTTTANSHAKHVSALGITDTTGCTNCHIKTANLTTANKFKDYTAASYHLNGSTNVVFNAVKAGATASWNQGTNVCSNVSCHGGNNATWGASLNCQDCHGNGASASVADFGTTFWNNGIISKFQMTGTGSWAGNGHGLASGTYASGNPAANFGVVTNQCEFCHDTTVGHKVSSNAFRLKNYSTAAYGRNAPCLICHSATGGGVISPAVKNRTVSAAVEADHYGSKHGASNNGGQFCWDCHDPHGNGTTNLYMVRSNPAKVSDRTTGAPTTQTSTAVVFTAKATGTDFANGTTYNGVCNVCHTSTSHYTSTSGDGHNATAACVTCHNHKGSTHGSDAFAPSGDCNSCHDYDTVGATYSGGKWTGGTWGKLNLGAYVTANEGWGAHNKHINFIKTRLGISTALTATTQTFGVGVPANICGTCHTNIATNHNLSATSGQDPTGRTINFGDSTFNMGGTGINTLVFGTPNPLYNGVSGTSSATTAKTCSNLSCHYFTTPLWSTY